MSTPLTVATALTHSSGGPLPHRSSPSPAVVSRPPCLPSGHNRSFQSAAHRKPVIRMAAGPAGAAVAVAARR